MRWFVRGDLDGFFGLALDNLVQLLLIDAQGSHRLPRASKTELAARLVQEIAGRLAEPGRSSASR